MADDNTSEKNSESPDKQQRKNIVVPQAAKELFVNATTNNGVEIALLEDKHLVELHQDQLNSSFSIGDIVLAKMQKILPGLNAAFVDIGFHKNGFLHYSDLGPQVRSVQKFTNKIGRAHV